MSYEIQRELRLHSPGSFIHNSKSELRLAQLRKLLPYLELLTSFTRALPFAVDLHVPGFPLSIKHVSDLSAPKPRRKTLTRQPKIAVMSLDIQSSPRPRNLACPLSFGFIPAETTLTLYSHLHVVGVFRDRTLRRCRRRCPGIERRNPSEIRCGTSPTRSPFLSRVSSRQSIDSYRTAFRGKMYTTLSPPTLFITCLR
jgi:hypothetical protein